MKTTTHVHAETLTVTRTYDASAVDVFDAWIDAGKTTHWWGCSQTSKVTSTIEARTGGAYQHMMHMDGMGDHLIDGRFTAYDPPHLLAYTMPGFATGEALQVRVTFEENKGATKVTLTQSPLPASMQDTVASGWTASFDRLAAYFEGARRAA